MIIEGLIKTLGERGMPFLKATVDVVSFIFVEQTNSVGATTLFKSVELLLKPENAKTEKSIAIVNTTFEKVSLQYFPGGFISIIGKLAICYYTGKDFFNYLIALNAGLNWNIDGLLAKDIGI